MIKHKFIYFILLLLLFSCNSSTNTTEVNKNTFEYISSAKNRSNLALTKTMLDANTTWIRSLYSNGSKFKVNNKKITLLMDETASITSSLKQDTKYSTVTLDNKEYLIEKGTLIYKPMQIKKKKVFTLEIKRSGQNTKSIIEKMMTDAIKKSHFYKKGGSGTIYPLGEIEYRINEKEIIIKEKFIIY